MQAKRCLHVVVKGQHLATGSKWEPSVACMLLWSDIVWPQGVNGSGRWYGWQEHVWVVCQVAHSSLFLSLKFKGLIWNPRHTSPPRSGRTPSLTCKSATGCRYTRARPWSTSCRSRWLWWHSCRGRRCRRDMQKAWGACLSNYDAWAKCIFLPCLLTVIRLRHVTC